jgi:hypothetical protein
MDVDNNHAGAIDEVRQLRFLQKVASEVDEALAKLEA